MKLFETMTISKRYCFVKKCNDRLYQAAKMVMAVGGCVGIKANGDLKSIPIVRVNNVTLCQQKTRSNGCRCERCDVIMTVEAPQQCL